MRKTARGALIALLILCAGYALWSRWDRHPPRETAELRLREIRSFGKATGEGNLLGIQPYMVPGDYATEARFLEKLKAYLEAAKARGFIGRKTVVVFPEYLGAWLVTSGEKVSVYQANTTAAAIRLLLLSNLPSFSRWYLSTHATDRAQAALFRMKGESMGAIYQRVFSRLAKQFGVTIVAGSIILPAPQVKDGALAVGNGPLMNVSVVYGPDGRAHEAIVKKAFLTQEEQRFLQAGAAQEIPVFATPAGRLGALICADSWYPAAYRSVKGADFLAVPAFLSPGGKWTLPWLGYSGAPAPSDVAPGDVKTLSEKQAWIKYALPGRIAESGARIGMTVFLHGRLWDLGADGQSFVILGGLLHLCPRVDSAMLVNVWIAPRERQQTRRGKQ